MVIESPQQYKSLAEIEAESEAGGGSQVAAAAAAAAVSERAVGKSFRDRTPSQLFPTSTLTLHPTSLEMVLPNKPLIAKDAALKIIF